MWEAAILQSLPGLEGRADSHLMGRKVDGHCGGEGRSEAHSDCLKMGGEYHFLNEGQTLRL